MIKIKTIHGEMFMVEKNDHKRRTDPVPGWGSICFHCKYQILTEKKTVEEDARFKCERMEKNDLKRSEDGHETCRGYFEDHEELPF